MKSLYRQLNIPKTKISIKEKEATFIYDFLMTNKIKKTLEVGFAFGCSTAHIISATKDKHYVIDPFQHLFKDTGINNIRNLKLSKHLIFINDNSYNALPKLLTKGVKINFAFIDGDHKFDSVFIDFYFIDLLLNHEGYVLFHDTWMRSIQHIVSWIKNNKTNYIRIKIPIKNMVLFQKKGDDQRIWTHFKGFCTIKSYLSHNISCLKHKRK